MESMSAEEILRNPGHMLCNARESGIAIVTRDGKLDMIVVPLGADFDAESFCLELAILLFDREEISLGVASRIAGLSIGEMINELQVAGCQWLGFPPKSLRKS